MKRSHPDVRAKCRSLYGPTWWDVDPMVKVQRQNDAIIELKKGDKRNTSLLGKTEDKKGVSQKNVSYKKDITSLKQIVEERFPNAKNVSIKRVDCALATCYDALALSVPLTNEKRWLFHGTSAISIPSILSQGFNRSFCGKNATLYGNGVYFAKDITFSASDIYSPPAEDGYKYILACKVLVGKYCLGKPNQKLPDLINETERFDSTVNDLKNPTIFVAYKDMQAIPEYLIKMKS